MFIIHLFYLCFTFLKRKRTLTFFKDDLFKTTQSVPIQRSLQLLTHPRTQNRNRIPPKFQWLIIVTFGINLHVKFFQTHSRIPFMKQVKKVDSDIPGTKLSINLTNGKSGRDKRKRSKTAWMEGSMGGSVWSRLRNDWTCLWPFGSQTDLGPWAVWIRHFPACHLLKQHTQVHTYTHMSTEKLLHPQSPCLEGPSSFKHILKTKGWIDDYRMTNGPPNDYCICKLIVHKTNNIHIWYKNITSFDVFYFKRDNF